MSGDFPFTTKIVSPLKCNEKPWDLWVSEIGHLSPQRDNDGTFTTPAAVDSKSSSSRRVHEAHPYKVADRGQARYRRAGLNRLKYESMSLHGLFPQMDNLNAAVCHMCGVIVKCSAAYRHLLESHSGSEPLLPPPPPTVKLKSALSRSRHKKEPPPTFPVDIHPVKMETSPVHTAAAPKSRLVLPQPDLQYLEEASTSSAITGEVQVSVESGELPVVSIQDDLPLGENLTDDILAIMNSEGIQSADDITIAADWKNIIKDIHDINFPSATDTLQSQDLYGASLDSSLSGYAIADTDLGNITFQSNSSPLISNVVESSIQNAQALKPTPATSKTKTQPRKSSKSKLKQREYDPNKHCGVFCVETLQPCTRSLTCKSHALSLRRTVEGRSKSFDTLLAEHRASKDAAAAGVAYTPAPVVHAPTAQLSPAALPMMATMQTTDTNVNLPPLLVNTSLDLGFNGLTADQQVNDIYASWLNVDDPILPDTSSITSLLSQPMQSDSFLLPDDAELPSDASLLNLTSPTQTTPSIREEKPEGFSNLAHNDVCWYSSSPRPLALCTFNASHAGSAVTLGKKFATVRSNIKSSLTRSTKSFGVTNNFFNHSMSLSKTLHINSANKTNKPEVRKLIVTCSANNGPKEVQQTLSDLFGSDVRHTLNGHLSHMDRKPRAGSIKTSKRPSTAVLDLGFSMDPLLADEKC
ncbi:ataxin-7-like protein 1 [Leptidea sinapis]|uniref:ataxin-7-like protein 1 n=1 Tax=Leptidea sinapis TaxID=189913 RepID=UPI0021C29AD5|nr:ataxin-7-like protein 1 [Leptidea sinapis]